MPRHGLYELYARKDKDGYPDPSAPFYRALDFTPAIVQLFGEHPETVVALKLGDKAGVLTARIVDAETGQPVSAGVVLINLQADARRDEIANGRFTELLPANTDIDVLVERMRIKDFGIGFDPSVLGKGLGLVTMQERLRMVGGVLRVNSVQGKGTEVEAEAKIRDATPEAA